MTTTLELHVLKIQWKIQWSARRGFLHACTYFLVYIVTRLGNSSIPKGMHGHEILRSTHGHGLHRITSSTVLQPSKTPTNRVTERNC